MSISPEIWPSLSLWSKWIDSAFGFASECGKNGYGTDEWKHGYHQLLNMLLCDELCSLDA